MFDSRRLSRLRVIESAVAHDHIHHDIHHDVHVLALFILAESAMKGAILLVDGCAQPKWFGTVPGNEMT